MAAKLTEQDIFNPNFKIKDLSLEELTDAYNKIMEKADSIRHNITQLKSASYKHKSEACKC